MAEFSTFAQIQALVDGVDRDLADTLGLLVERTTERDEALERILVLEAEVRQVNVQNGHLADRNAELSQECAQLLARIAELEKPPAPSMIPGDSYEASAANYAAEAEQFGYRAKFVYWPGTEAHTFANGLASIPADHEAIVSVAKTDGLEAALDEWQATHTGNLYVVAFQEPEKNLTPAQWKTLARGVSAACAGRDRCIPSLEFTAYAISSVLGDYYDDTLGLEAALFSCYALVDANGIPKVDPVDQINKCADWAEARGLIWSVAAAGYPLTAERRVDPAHVNRRIEWVTAHYRQAETRGSKHYLWFNTADYRLQLDPAFAAVWLDLIGA